MYTTAKILCISYVRRNRLSYLIEMGNRNSKRCFCRMLDFHFHTLEVAYITPAMIILHTNLLAIAGLQCLGSNPIQIPSSASRDTSSSSLLILFQHSNLFKSLQDLSLDTSTTLKMTTWTGSTVLTTAMDFTKGANTDGFAEVDVSCDSCGSDVKPVWVVWCEFLE